MNSFRNESLFWIQQILKATKMQLMWSDMKQKEATETTEINYLRFKTEIMQTYL